MPRRDTPCVVGWATTLDVRRNRLNPGTWRSRSSTVWAGVVAMSGRVMTVTLAGVSPAFRSMRVGVTTTGSRRGVSSGAWAVAGDVVAASQRRVGRQRRAITVAGWYLIDNVRRARYLVAAPST